MNQTLPPSERFAKIKRDRNRLKLTDAYLKYLNEGHEDALWLAVLEFATVKLCHLEYEFKDIGTANTADDFAQETVIKVWENLPSFKGEPESFYAWVHKIAFNHATDFKTELIRKKQKFSGLTVTMSDEDGEQTEIDNPAIYGDVDDTLDFRIPASVTGIDRHICELLSEKVDRQPTAKNRNPKRGLTHAEIGEHLNMKPDAVKKRLERLKKKYSGILEEDAEAAA